MRKFTSLMLMLLCAVTTWAQSAPEAGSIYRIKHVASNLYFTTADFTKTGGEGAFKLQSVVEDPSQLFTLVPSETAGQFYLKQTKDETEYYVKAASWNFFASTTDKTSFTISLVDGETSVYTLNQTQQNAHHGAAGVDNTAEGSSIYCNKSGNNAKWSFEYVGVEFSTVTINYNFKYNGALKYKQSVQAIAGEAYPTATVALPYGVVAGAVPEGNVSAEDATDGVITVDIPLTVGTLPFVAAETADGITNWYYMQMHWNNKHYVAANGTAIEWKEAAVPEDNKDAYTWGFVGNIFDGFKVVNYAAYNEEGNDNTTLAWNNGTSLTTFNAATQFPMVHTGWSSASAESFCLAIPNTNTANYLNAQGTTVVSWSDADAGSTFTLTERPMTLNAELEVLIAEYEAKNIVAGTNPGEYTAAAVEVFNAAIATAKAVTAATQNDIDALTTAYTNLAVNPVTEGTYMIVSANTSKNVQVALSCYGYTETWGPVSYSPAWAELDVNNPWQYWTLEENGDGFSIKATNEGKYITSISTFTETAAVATFTLLENAQYNIFLGESITPLHTNGWNWSGETSGGLIEYNGGVNTASAWKLVKVTSEPTLKHTLAMSDAGWATLHVGFNTIIPEGVKCYTVSELKGNYAVLKEVTDVLPANTPVLVQRNEGNINTSFAFNYTAESGDAVGNNELRGSHFRSKVTPAENTTYYVLAIVDGVVGLYKDQLSDNIFRNNANKAYLPVVAEAEGNAAASYSFNFDWAGTTGIEGVVAEGAQNGKIYDITGREVKAITAPGIYIVNGRKVVK